MFDLALISSDRRVLPPRIILLGTPKIGKTTFASSFPGVVMLPVAGEEGADDIGVPKFPTAMSLREVYDDLDALRDQEHKFTFVCIDSTTALERLLFASVCETNKWANIETPGYGKGYAVAVNEWNELTNRLDVLRKKCGMGCILIGHVTVKTVNDPMGEPYDSYVWDLNKNAAGLLTKWSDEVLFAKLKSFAKETSGGKVHAVGTEHILLTQERPSHPGGGRGVYGHLPYELKLDYKTYAAAVSAEFDKLEKQGE